MFDRSHRAGIPQDSLTVNAEHSTFIRRTDRAAGLRTLAETPRPRRGFGQAYSWNAASENLLLVVSITRTVSRAVAVGSTDLSVLGRPLSVTM